MQVAGCAVMLLDPGTLHYVLVQQILERGSAPSIEELVHNFDTPREDVSAALHALAEDHGVVLHPNSDEIWIIHPFSTAPTNFIVRSGQMEWWGNCAWCSLGIAELAGGTATITTTLGTAGRQVIVAIERGMLLDKNYVIHFPIPMTRAWDNVVYTCSMMLLFETEADVDIWCARHRKPKGDVRPLEQIWTFAQEWYGRHADPNWRKWTSDEAAAMFHRHRLTGPIWEIAATKDRF